MSFPKKNQACMMKVEGYEGNQCYREIIIGRYKTIW